MEITATKVKELRDKSGAGMMDCKKALTETGGDMEAALDLLRKKGIADAEKRSGRETKEGIVDAYIHPGNRLGVLVEVNCETDFVARTDDFREFVRNIAMQIAAANPAAIAREDVDQSVIDKEKEILAEQAKDQKKPDHIVEKIIEGRLEKFFKEICLLEQQYVKNPDISIQDLVTEVKAKLGENVSIRRFSRFRLGEN